MQRSELQKLEEKLGVTDSKVRTNILEIVKIKCLLFAVCLIFQSTYDAELEKIELKKKILTIFWQFSTYNFMSENEPKEKPPLQFCV